MILNKSSFHGNSFKSPFHLMIMEHIHGSAEERRSAEALRESMGLTQNLPIAKRGFTKAQRDYFIACNEMGIHYKTSAELMGVTRPERV